MYFKADIVHPDNIFKVNAISISPARCSLYKKPLGGQDFTPKECRKEDVLCSDMTLFV